MLSHLYLSGKIQKCSGIILGQFTDCKDDNGVNIEDLLLEKLRLFKNLAYTTYAQDMVLQDSLYQ